MLAQTGEGSGGSAGTYTVTGTLPAILVVSGGKTVDAITVYASENVYGVTYEFTIPMTTFMGEGPDAAAGLYAGYIQAYGSIAYVQGIQYARDTNASGNLIDTLIITVGSADLSFLADVSIPLLTADTPANFGVVGNAWAKLQALGATA